MSPHNTEDTHVCSLGRGDQLKVFQHMHKKARLNLKFFAPQTPCSLCYIPFLKNNNNRFERLYKIHTQNTTWTRLPFPRLRAEKHPDAKLCGTSHTMQELCWHPETAKQWPLHGHHRCCGQLRKCLSICTLEFC